MSLKRVNLVAKHQKQKELVLVLVSARTDQLVRLSNIITLLNEDYLIFLKHFFLNYFKLFCLLINKISKKSDFSIINF